MLYPRPGGDPEQPDGLFFCQRMDFFSFRFRQHAAGGGIPRYVIQLYSLSHGDMQDPIQNVDRGGRKAAQDVYKILNGVRVQFRQADGPQAGADMVLDIAFVGIGRGGLYIAQIILCPDVQPLSHGEPGGVRIGPAVDGHGGGLKLLPDLLLCFAGKGTLDLLSRSGVPARGDAGLPISILFPAPCDGLLRMVPPPLAPFFAIKNTCPFKNGCNEPRTGVIITLF